MIAEAIEPMQKPSEGCQSSHSTPNDGRGQMKRAKSHWWGAKTITQQGSRPRRDCKSPMGNAKNLDQH
jgi:hypothetical protein